MKAKKIFYFFMLLLCVLGLIGGIGYTIYYGTYAVTVGIAALGYTAFPKAKEYFEKLCE